MRRNPNADQLLVEMLKERNPKASTALNLRRSPRFLPKNHQEPNNEDPLHQINCNASEKPTTSNHRSIICAIPASNSFKISRLRNAFASPPVLRRSPRFSNVSKNVVDEKSVVLRDSALNVQRLDFSVLGKANCDGEGLFDKMGRELVMGIKAVKVGEGSKTSERCGLDRKRKRGEGDGNERRMEGWTKEQELALQRAYFVTKPTPNFWKNVSKLVFLLYLDYVLYVCD